MSYSQEQITAALLLFDKTGSPAKVKELLGYPSIAMLEFKCWYYDTAIADGNENKINVMLPDNLPKEIQKLYNKAH